MSLQSLVVDDFFTDPDSVRKLILAQDFADREASDLVTYPGIADLPKMVSEEMFAGVNHLIGGLSKERIEFARVTHYPMKPPNWAHCDADLGEWTALVYLTPEALGDGSTVFVKHRDGKFSSQPKTQANQDRMMRDSNDLEKWKITGRCAMKWNRLFLARSEWLHAALPQGGFGNDPETGRLVLTMFLKGLEHG